MTKHPGIVYSQDGIEMMKVEVTNPSYIGRLDNFLKIKLKRYSRARIQRIIKAGNLKVSGKIVKKSSFQLHGGELIDFLRPVPENDSPIDDIEVVFFNDKLLVLNKPPDLLLHPTANVLKRTLTWWINGSEYNGYVPAHRLDRETSGIIICAKRGRDSSILKTGFINNQVKKGYLAILRGILKQSQVVDMPIGENSDSPIKIKVGINSSGAPSKTKFIPISHGNNSTLAAVFPQRGRQHQIRVHSEFMNYPLYGDKIYGVESDIFLKFIEDGMTGDLLNILKVERHMLHACAISFNFPELTTNNWFFIYPPEDFVSFAKIMDLQIPNSIEIEKLFKSFLY